MISVAELQTAIFQRIEHYLAQDNPLNQRAKISLPLLQSLGHILAQDIIAGFDIPGQAISAMDGFAFNLQKSDSNQPFTIIGESGAGNPFTGNIAPQQGVRIFTGAVVPSDFDTVVMQEDVDFEHQATIPYAMRIAPTANLSVGKHIRQQGEEIRQHDVVLTQGKRLNPSDISLLANLGMAEVTVYAPLSVALIATGDELLPVGTPLPSLAHIYNSNTPTLQALLAPLPITIQDFGIVADDLTALKATFSQALMTADVIITTAGVSVGDYDYLTTLIAELGQINQYKVAMKPGKPFVFGELRKPSGNVLYFGLPGNPLSTVVGCMQFIQPALWHMAGTSESEIPKPLLLNATLTADVKKTVGRQDYQRAIMHPNSSNGQGNITVTPLASQDSHRVHQLTQANCLMILPSESTGAKAGETVTVQPFPWAFG